MSIDLRAPFLLAGAAGTLALVTTLALLAAPGGRTAPRRTILVTGFGPFAGLPSNPAWESIRDLDGAVVAGALVRTATLTVAYEEAPAQLRAALEATRPDLVLCLGVAPGDQIRLEALARNRDDAPVPDVKQVVRQGPIRADGPALLPTRLPVAALQTRLEAGGYEVRSSDDAGGYLCNHVFYTLMSEIPEHLPAGFVHVPEMGGPWDLPRLARAVRAMIEVLAQGPGRPAGGAHVDAAP